VVCAAYNGRIPEPNVIPGHFVLDSRSSGHVDERTKQALLARNDPRLRQLVVAATDGERTGAIEELVTAHARPLAEQVVARHRRSEPLSSTADVDDIVSTVLLRLVRRLQAVPFAWDAAIERLDDFVATLAYHAVYDFLRRRFPARRRLKSRLRYLLTHDARFALWTVDDEVRCGLAEWRGSTAVAAGVDVTEHATESAAAVEAIFRQAGQPLRLETLVTIAAEAWQITDRPEPVASDDAPSPLAAMENRQFLETLWAEIGQLRPLQRAALLLNLRDAEGGNATALLVMLGIASLEEIAAAASLTPARMQELWDELPLDDLTIASMLGVTRQQVINLRRSARERLGRRFGDRLR
jgi:DNA-directed RNA polymerase specialized sigma24 family protein